MTAKDPEGDEFALRLPDKKVPFAISTDGQLTVNGPLDREQKDEYQFDVIGMDSYHMSHMYFCAFSGVKSSRHNINPYSRKREFSTVKYR